jgi:WhiB family redox-sensing transcriptional regulator
MRSDELEDEDMDDEVTERTAVLVRGSTPRPAGGSRLGKDDQETNLLWLNHIACADMDLGDFFVDAGHAIINKVLNVCRSCPVRLECLNHAYNMKVSGGYFGGLSPGQRREYDLDEAIEFVIADGERQLEVGVVESAIIK